MPSVASIQRVIDEIVSGSLPNEQICALLKDPSPVVRANAFDALGKRNLTDPKLVEQLILAVGDPLNGFRLMGTVTVAFVGIKCLLSIHTDETRNAAKVFLSQLSEQERADLLRYLESENITMDK